MELGLGEVIFGLAALACFIVPVVYLQRRNSQEKKKFLKEFIRLAEQQQLSIKAHDFWNHTYAIGLDPQKNRLFYLKKGEGVEQKVVIDLAGAEKCTVININKRINDSLIIDRLALKLSFQNGKLPEKILEFYSKEESMSVNDEVELTTKWAALLNAHLQSLQADHKIVMPAPNTVIAA